MASLRGLASPLGLLALPLAGLVLALLLLSPPGRGSNASLAADEEELELAAIQGLHGQLDDNRDGAVDFNESDEFLQTELQDESSEKSHKFHESDISITPDDLWKSWHNNDAFNWTNDDIVCWLEDYVKLPQYSAVFRKHNVTGRHLPRIANNTRQILQAQLLISDSKHRHKIQLRAMDVVLFGPPAVHSSIWKDFVVALSISLCVTGILYAIYQRRVAQSRIDTFLESICDYEKELTDLKERLEQQEECDDDNGKDEGDSPQEEVTSSVSPDSPEEKDDLLEEFGAAGSLSLAQQEIAALHRRVMSLESRLLAVRVGRGHLQQLLQLSHRQEWEHLDRRKKTAEEEMTSAQRVCDKIKRRRSSIIGTFRLANSTALEDAGLQITKAVNHMQKISLSIEEYHKRWRKLEQACGFPISAASPTDSASSSPAGSSPRVLRLDSVSDIGLQRSLSLTPADTIVSGSPLLYTRSSSSQLWEQAGSHFSDPDIPIHQRFQSQDSSESSGSMDWVDSGLQTSRLSLHDPLLRHSTSLPQFRRTSCPEELCLGALDEGGLTFSIAERTERGSRKQRPRGSGEGRSQRRSSGHRSEGSTSSLGPISEEAAQKTTTPDNTGEDSDQSSGSQGSRRLCPQSSREPTPLALSGRSSLI